MANEKKSNLKARAPAPKVKVTVTTKGKQRKRSSSKSRGRTRPRSRQRSASIVRKEIRPGIRTIRKANGILRKSTGKMHSVMSARTISDPATKSLVMSSVLPYEGPMLRVRAGQQSSISTSSATTRNHIFYDIDLQSVMAVDSVCGTVANRAVWQNLHEEVSIVSILDARLMGVVPFRTNVVNENNIYSATLFMNPNQDIAGVFVFEKDNVLIFGTGGNVRSFGDVNDDVYWLDPVDWYPAGNSDIYGDIHPALDGPDGRYVWIDAMEPDELVLANQSTITCSLTDLSPIWTIPSNGDGRTSTVYLVVESLQKTSNQNDTLVYRGTFLPGGGGGLGWSTAASAIVEQSGYYRVGVAGQMVLDPNVAQDTLNPFTCHFALQYALDRRINIGSRHILNKNIITSSTPSSFNLFDTFAANFGSCLVKNTTPDLFKGGMVYAVTNSTDDSWYTFTSDLDKVISSTADPKLVYNGMWKKGCYGWLRNSCFGFRPGVATTTCKDGTQISCIRSWSISRMSDRENSKWRAMNVYTLSPAEAFAAKITTTLLFTVQFEYTTLSQIPVQSSKAILNIQPALQALCEAPSFTENPLHLGKFMEIVRSAGRNMLEFYKDNRKTAVPMFAALSSFGGPIGSMVGRALTGLDSALFD